MNLRNTLALAVSLSLIIQLSGRASTYTWDENGSKGGNGNWDTTTPNWTTGAGTVDWVNSNIADFATTTGGTPVITITQPGITVTEIQTAGLAATINSDGGANDVLNFSESANSNALVYMGSGTTGELTINSNIQISNSYAGTSSVAYQFGTSGSAGTGSELLITGNIIFTTAPATEQLIVFNPSVANTMEFDGTVGSLPTGTSAGFDFEPNGANAATLNPTFILKGADTNVTGASELFEGTLELYNSSALGSGGLQLGTSSATSSSTVTLLAMTSGLTIANNLNTYGLNTSAAPFTVGGAQTSGTSTFSGNIDLGNLSGGGGTATLYLTSAGGGTTDFTGEIYDVHTTGSNGSGAGTAADTTYGVTKIGAGTAIVTGANAYGGPTTVNAGTFLANNTSGSATGAGHVYVTPTGSGNATFGGTGGITGGLTVGGGAGTGTAILAPGTDGSIGTLAVGGGVGFSSGGSFHFDLNSSTMASGTVFSGGSFADLLNVVGSLSLGNGTATLVGTDLGNLTLSLGDVIELVTYTGSESGYFNGYTDGSDINIGSNDYQINYGTLAGYGSDVTLEVVAAPEPSVSRLLDLGLVGLLCGSFARRLRRLGLSGLAHDCE